MDIEALKQFVAFCNTPLKIEIGVTCSTDMSDGIVQKVDGEKVELWHMYKGYEQWWNIKNIKSAETNLSRLGINKCLEMFLQNN